MFHLLPFQLIQHQKSDSPFYSSVCFNFCFCLHLIFIIYLCNIFFYDKELSSFFNKYNLYCSIICYHTHMHTSKRTATKTPYFGSSTVDSANSRVGLWDNEHENTNVAPLPPQSPEWKSPIIIFRQLIYRDREFGKCIITAVNVLYASVFPAHMQTTHLHEFIVQILISANVGFKKSKCTLKKNVYVCWVVIWNVVWLDSKFCKVTS